MPASRSAAVDRVSRVRFGTRRGSGTLSIGCVTDQPPEQTAAVLEPLRAVADEIVIGIRPRCAAGAEAYARLADQVLLLDTGPFGADIATIHAVCTGEWVLWVDADEIPSPTLIRRLPELITDRAVRQYAFTRRWLTASGDRWIAEHPWWPDWQVRLVRRETAAFSPEGPVPVELDAPRRFVTEPIYHAAVALLSPAERRRKMLEYEIVHRGGPGSLREPTAVIYEPERHATRAPAPLPAADLEAVRRFFKAAAGVHPRAAQAIAALGATAPPNAPQDLPERITPATTWPAIPDPACQEANGDGAHQDVTIELLEPRPPFVSGEPATVQVRLTNQSDAWLRSPAVLGEAGHAVSYHWHPADPEAAPEEGSRTLLPHSLGPAASAVVTMQVTGPRAAGPHRLAVSVVDEHVRWLTGRAAASVEVAPPAPLPTAREVRPTTGSPIPRILHRIWLGDAPLPEAYRAYGEEWSRLHPGWEMRLWTDADAPRPQGVERARNLAERADLIRYEILRRHGGVYVDTDVEALRPIDDLLVGVEAFAAYEVPGRLCNAVMGCIAGHPAIAELVELAAVTVGYGHFPEATATTFATCILEAHPNVTLFSADRFYPELWDGRANQGEASYARHHWAQSWA